MMNDENIHAGLRQKMVYWLESELICNHAH